MTTPSTIAEQIEKLDREASPGPWSYDLDHNCISWKCEIVADIEMCEEHNAHLMAEYRTLAPDMAAAWRKERADLDRAHSHIRELKAKLKSAITQLPRPMSEAPLRGERIRLVHTAAYSADIEWMLMTDPDGWLPLPEEKS